MVFFGNAHPYHGLHTLRRGSCPNMYHEGYDATQWLEGWAIPMILC